MVWTFVALHNAHIKCCFYKWLIPPSNMHVNGFHIDKKKAWAISLLYEYLASLPSICLGRHVCVHQLVRIHFISLLI